MLTWNEYQNNVNVKAWEKTGLLNGLNEQEAVACATALENQRRYNEHAAGPTCVPNTTDQRKMQWMRVSVPVVRRIFGVVPNLESAVGVGAKAFPTEFEVKCHLNSNETNVREALDKEAEETAELAQKLGKFVADGVESRTFSQFAHLGLEDGKVVVYAK